MDTNASMRTPLGRVRGLGSAKSGTEHFWRQRVTAVANVPLVLFLVGLIVTLVGKSHAAVMATVGHPVVAILLVLTVLSVTAHMRLGMQVIIEDYVHDEGRKLLAVMANTFFSVAVAAAAIFAILKISFGV